MTGGIAVTRTDAPLPHPCVVEGEPGRMGSDDGCEGQI